MQPYSPAPTTLFLFQATLAPYSRGVGKTVLLLEFETLAHESGWVCNDVEEVGSGDFRQTFAELAYQLLLSVSRRERMHTHANAAFRVLKAFSVGVPGGFSARLDVSSELVSGSRGRSA
jgi:hypothetical protein